MFCKIAILAACALCILTSSNGPAAPIQLPDETSTYTAALEGGKLTEAEAATIESGLKTNPNDVLSRIRLLGYYFNRSFSSESARAAKQRHIMWIIRNAPEASVAGLPYTQLSPDRDGQAYTKAKQLWQQQVKAHPKDTAIIGNAASFFLLYDAGLAEDLFRKGQSLEPKNPDWPAELAHLYSLGMRCGSAESRQKAADKALTQYEKAYSLTLNDINKFYLLDSMANTAFEAGATDKARTYAEKLLKEADKYKDDWNYGNAIHFGNLVLGRIALKSDDIKGAKDYLIAAGKTPGSPQLDSFGPTMSLAKELLAKGEKDAVLEYFTLCGNFWKMGQDNLQKWTADVKSDKTPDFGSNLNY